MNIRLRPAILTLMLLAGSSNAFDRALTAQVSTIGQPGTLRGFVVNPDGGGRPGVLLELRGGDATIRSAISGANGEYRFSDLPHGEYWVRAVPEEQWPSTAADRIPIVGREVVRNLVLREAHTAWRRSLLAGMLLSYLLILLLFRHYHIVRPAREVLYAQARAVRIRLRLEGDSLRSADLTSLAEELERLSGRITARPYSEIVFWSQGREIGSWRSLHEIERQFVAFMIPPARIVEFLHSAAAELSTVTTPEAAVLTARIGAVLNAAPAGDPVDPAVQLEQQKQVLAEALSVIYDERDTAFAGMMEWHNKAMWLAVMAMMVIAALALVFGHEELFLVGAAGGLMSRMARSLHREDVPTDYGASWTTLFLSPLLGAIGAWFGILLIMVLATLGVLGGPLAGVGWDRVALYSPLVLGLALVLGFSERFFLSLLSAVEGRIGDQTSKAVSPRLPAAGSVPLLVGASVNTASSGAGTAQAPRDPTGDLIERLEVRAGERVGLVADAGGTSREKLQRIAGAGNVHVVEWRALATVAPLDAVLVEVLPPASDLDAMSAVVAASLASGGRLVVVGSTPAVAFAQTAAAHRQQNHAGPTLAGESLTAAGLVSEEPPERISSGDPVRWVAVFSKP